MCMGGCCLLIEPLFGFSEKYFAGKILLKASIFKIYLKKTKFLSFGMKNSNEIKFKKILCLNKLIKKFPSINETPKHTQNFQEYFKKFFPNFCASSCYIKTEHEQQQFFLMKQDKIKLNKA
ncbi:hypothetical protein ACKWTF_013772 [Chironomus riparius]